jgi:hypothetical protein
MGIETHKIKMRRQQVGAARAAERCTFFLISGTLPAAKNCRFRNGRDIWRRNTMNGLIYLVGLVVVILAVLSFFGLR